MNSSAYYLILKRIHKYSQNLSETQLIVINILFCVFLSKTMTFSNSFLRKIMKIVTNTMKLANTISSAKYTAHNAKVSTKKELHKLCLRNYSWNSSESYKAIAAYLRSTFREQFSYRTLSKMKPELFCTQPQKLKKYVIIE